MLSSEDRRLAVIARKALDGRSKTNRGVRARLALQLGVSINAINSVTRTDQNPEARFKARALPASWVRPICEAAGDDRLALEMLTPRARGVFELGQRVADLEMPLEEILQRIQQLKGGPRRKK